MTERPTDTQFLILRGVEAGNVTVRFPMRGGPQPQIGQKRIRSSTFDALRTREWIAVAPRDLGSWAPAAVHLTARGERALAAYRARATDEKRSP